MIHVLDALEHYSKISQYQDDPFTYIKIIAEFYKLNITFDQYHGGGSDDKHEIKLKDAVRSHALKTEGR